MRHLTLLAVKVVASMKLSMFAEAVSQLKGVDSTTEHSNLPKRGALDIEANSTVGYNPSTSIEQGIEKYVEYLLRA